MLQYLKTTWQKIASALAASTLAASALAASTLAIVAVLLLWATPIQAATLSTTKTPTVKADPAYLQGVESMRKQAETEADSPTNQALKDVLNQLFTPPAVQIPFRFVKNEAATPTAVKPATPTPTTAAAPTIAYSGNIYFSQGAIFVNYDGVANDDHFATIDSKLYTWKTGATQGEIIKRFPGDTLAFVMYMIDPSAIMRSIYVQYLDDPKLFTVKSGNNGEKSILFKQVKDGFKGIKIQEKPFWLKAFLLEASKDKGGQMGSLEIDAPIALEALPQELFILPKGVTFKPSQETLKNRMTYL